VRPLGAHEGRLTRDVHTEDLLVEEHDRAQRLVLRGCRHPLPGGQVVEKAYQVRLPELPRVAQAVESNIATDPKDVGLLGAPRVVQPPQRGPHSIKQANGLGSAGAGIGNLARRTAPWKRLGTHGSLLSETALFETVYPYVDAIRRELLDFSTAMITPARRALRCPRAVQPRIHVMLDCPTSTRTLRENAAWRRLNTCSVPR